MAMHVDITEAQQRFMEIIHAAERGESVIITKNMRPIVQITAAQQDKGHSAFGSARGLVVISDDFDAPIDEFREYMP